MKTVLLLFILFHTVCFSQEINVNYLESFLGTQFNINQNKEGYELLKKEYVNVDDFLKYQKDIRDSVALESIYFEIEDDIMALDYLNLNRRQKKTVNKHDRNQVRSNYHLNRNDRKLMRSLYTGTYHVPLLTFLRIPRWKRYLFNSPYTFDDRNVFYRSTDTSKTYSILMNQWTLAEESQHSNDLLNVITKRYLVFDTEKPAIGLSDHQIEGYLNWKKHELETLLKSKGVHSEMSVILIKEKTKLNFIIKKEQLLSQWEITKDEYAAFLVKAEDSLTREYLYFNLKDVNKAIKFLDYADEYFDEIIYEYVEFDSYDSVKNRRLFNLNYTTRIKKNNDEINVLLQLFHKEMSGNTIPYSYVEMDARKQINNFAETKYSEDNYRSHKYDLFCLDTVQVELRKIDENEHEGSMLSTLSYEEALAFYHWKYPMNKATIKDNWEKYVFPSKEEFSLLKEGIVKDIRVSVPIKPFSYKIILK